MKNTAKLVTVTLSKPVKVDGEEITEIKLRKPTAGEMRGVNLAQLAVMNTDAMLAVLPRITQPSLTEQQLAGEDVDLSDFMEMAGVVVNTFFGKALGGA